MHRGRYFSATAIAFAAIAGIATAAGMDARSLTFQTHAAFFSSETKQAKPIDPQVFVKADNAPEAVGPQNIKHVAGYRPALITEDPPMTNLYNAQGVPLGFTLAQWLGASGKVELRKEGASEVVIADFQKLRPNSQYSLFENHFDQTPVGFTPLDGKGIGNSFKSDGEGNAHVIVPAPAPLTEMNAVLAVYDIDGQTHGMTRGEIGVNAAHQLIARPAK